jgi:uncharacterized protein (TIGR02246 family)
MKTAYLALVPLVALLVLVGGLSSASAQTGDAALDKLAADYAAAWADGDAEALANLHTENAIRVTQGGVLLGRAAIQEEFAPSFMGALKGTTITINSGRVQALRFLGGAPTVAVSEGTYEIAGIRTPDGELVPPVKGSYLNTIIKSDGAWLIASNSALPPAAPPEQ